MNKPPIAHDVVQVREYVTNKDKCMGFILYSLFSGLDSVALGILLTNRLNQFLSKRIFSIIQDVLDSCSIFIQKSKPLEKVMVLSDVATPFLNTKQRKKKL